jgi:type I protein arginine methyltransferase
MIRDRVRMEAYATALRRAIEPGATVVDIGTGTGIMACLACAYGAARVYALEPADVIESARQIAQANGFAERIHFIQKPSTDVTLAQRADVIVSDLRGVLPLFQDHLAVVADARRRLLKPGGLLIPRRDVLRVAVASAVDLHERHVTPWERNEYGLDMSAVSRIETNAWRQCRARREHVCLEPQTLATVDYTTVEGAGVMGDARWSVGRRADAHGLIVWFDTDLGQDVGFTNAPGAPELIYGQAFFPWPRAVGLQVGDTVAATITATPVGKDYVWTWTTRVADENGAITAEFRQSSFFGVPRSGDTLARRAPQHVPSLSQEGRLDRLVLELFAEQVPLGRIADEVFAKFAARLGTREQALARVADLSVRYSDGP